MRFANRLKPLHLNESPPGDQHQNRQRQDDGVANEQSGPVKDPTRSQRPGLPDAAYSRSAAWTQAVSPTTALSRAATGSIP